MAQRSFSPCYFGNKVTMAFKLIFVFAVIAVIAVDAGGIKTCGGKVQVRNVKISNRVITGQYKVNQSFQPRSVRINGKKLSLAGCNKLKTWVKGDVNCGKGWWKQFRIPNVPNGEYTVRVYSDNAAKRQIACFKKDD